MSTAPPFSSWPSRRVLHPSPPRRPFVTTPLQKQQRNKQITFPRNTFLPRNLLRDTHPFPARCPTQPPRVSTLPSFLPLPPPPPSPPRRRPLLPPSSPLPRCQCTGEGAQCHLLSCPRSRLSSFSTARIFSRSRPPLPSSTLFPSSSPSRARPHPRRLFPRAGSPLLSSFSRGRRLSRRGWPTQVDSSANARARFRL